MYRNIIYFFFLLLLPNMANALNEKRNDSPYEYEYIKPKTINEEIIFDPKEDIKNFSQYNGDHNKKWYKKQNKERNKYISFAINYSVSPDLDVKADNIFYPNALNSETNAGYEGVMNRKGGLGIDLAYGFQINKLMSLEIEAHYNRSYVQSFTTTKINNITRGTYTEKGPAIDNNSADEVLNAVGATGNVIINFPRRKLSPYIGFGYGMSVIGISSDYNAHELMMAKLGMNYRLSNKVSFYLQAKQMVYDKVKYSYKTSQTETEANYSDKQYNLEHDLEDTIISIGYKFNFN